MKGKCKWLNYDENLCTLNECSQCEGKENCEDFEEQEE